MDPMPAKCPVCWGAPGGPPPYLWDKAAAPNIPKGKDDLVLALSKCNQDEKTLRSLGRDELRHLFRKHVRGERHPNDCAHRMGSLSKPELGERVHAHGLLTGQDVVSMSKGFCQTMLRAHWKEQCELAAGQWHPTSGCDDDSDESDNWENVNQCDKAGIAMKQFLQADATMSAAMQQVFEQAGAVPNLARKVADAAKAYECFIDAMQTVGVDLMRHTEEN